MSVKTKTIMLKTILLAGLALGSTTVFADDCSQPGPYSTLVSNIIQGQALGTGPTANNTVCVDVPVGLNVEHAMFNIDAQHTTNGTSGGYPVALRHMWMLGTANLARINGRIKMLPTMYPGWADLTAEQQAKVKEGIKNSYHIVGIMHGSAITWALSDAWWAANVPGATANPVKEWLDKIAGLRAKGLDITLEACGVTMYGKGLTNADLYTDANGNREILVNQGAIGRIIDLQERLHYAYIQEGSVKSLVSGANN